MLETIAYSLPMLLVVSVGAILSLVNLKRIPRGALMSLLGCGLILLTRLTSLTLNILHRQDMIPADQYRQISDVMGIVGTGGFALGLGLIVAAVFVGRKAQQRPRPMADEEEARGRERRPPRRPPE